MASVSAPLPRVTIQFCTQCKWMLRAAYFAQELLSTFSTALGEVALQPSTGGTFTVSLYSANTTPSSRDSVQVQCHVIWDRKAEGGFPETKELKKRVRDIIEPGRDLGHVDGKKTVIATKRSEPASEQENLQGNQTANQTGQLEKAMDLGQEMLERPAIPNPLIKEQGFRGNPTPAEVNINDDGLDPNKKTRGGKIMPNPDANICEDCK